MICDGSTWVPYTDEKTRHCRELRRNNLIPGIVGTDLGGRNCATFWYWHPAFAGFRHITCCSESASEASWPPGQSYYSNHSERVCYEELRNAEPGAWIFLVYTEREPCGPGAGMQNCRAFLGGLLDPWVSVYWTFRYPPTPPGFSPPPPPPPSRKRPRDGGDDEPDPKRIRRASTSQLKKAVKTMVSRGSDSVQDVYAWGRSMGINDRLYLDRVNQILRNRGALR